MSLNIAMVRLLSTDHHSYVQYARELLKYFVQKFEQINGRHIISHNIHSLVHIADDYELYGPLDYCCNFYFKNYMKTLKSVLRKPNRPLELVILRYHEQGQITNITTNEIIEKTYRLSEPHNKRHNKL